MRSVLNCFGSWIKERVIYTFSAVVSVEWVEERDIFMCGVLVSVHGLKNEIHSCVALSSAEVRWGDICVR